MRECGPSEETQDRWVVSAEPGRKSEFKLMGEGEVVFAGRNMPHGRLSEIGTNGGFSNRTKAGSNTYYHTSPENGKG